MSNLGRELKSDPLFSFNLSELKDTKIVCHDERTHALYRL